MNLSVSVPTSPMHTNNITPTPKPISRVKSVLHCQTEAPYSKRRAARNVGLSQTRRTARLKPDMRNMALYGRLLSRILSSRIKTDGRRTCVTGLEMRSPIYTRLPGTNLEGRQRRRRSRYQRVLHFLCALRRTTRSLLLDPLGEGGGILVRGFYEVGRRVFRRALLVLRMNIARVGKTIANPSSLIIILLYWLTTSLRQPPKKGRNPH